MPKDPLKENIQKNRYAYSMPFTEGKHELANSLERSETGLLRTRKAPIIAALQMKEETGSMDVCRVWILLLQKLNLLWT